MNPIDRPVLKSFKRFFFLDPINTLSLSPRRYMLTYQRASVSFHYMLMCVSFTLKNYSPDDTSN